MNRKMFFAQNIMSTPSSGLGYGYLYNSYAVSHANFATSGWHVPTLTEIQTLYTYLGGFIVAGGKMKEAGLSHWLSPNTGATNSSGFTGFGGGTRSDLDGVFSNIKVIGNFWTSTAYNSSESYFYYLTSDDAVVNYYREGNAIGYSVRLVKDSTTLSNGETSTMTDEDGNVYDTICIGTQEWTVQNWKCTKLNDGTSLTKVTSDATWAAASTGDLYYCAYDNDESNV
jgi:uncharacterized protein (TIGR02145 family)